MRERLRRWIPMGAREVLGMNRRNVEYVLPRNPREHFDIANDKLKGKRVLDAAGVAVVATLGTFETFFDVGELDQRLAGLDDFAIKPARGSGGRGILVVAERRGELYQTVGGSLLDRHQLRRHIADIVYGVYSMDRADVAIVEPRLIPHPFFANLYDRGLSDVRIIVVDDVPIAAMIRVPTAMSDGKANLHQGGLGLGLDLVTGCVTHAQRRGREIATHPDSGVPVVGITVPQWVAMVELAVAASKAVPLNYLGVDLILDARLGPVVLEINVRPGLEIQNVTGAALRPILDTAAREAAL